MSNKLRNEVIYYLIPPGFNKKLQPTHLDQLETIDLTNEWNMASLNAWIRY